MRTWTASAMLSALTLGSAIPASAQAPQREGPVTRIDHFYAESAAFQELLRFFKNTLQLPEAWPDQDYGSFATGAVSLGNITFEVLRFATSPVDGASFGGIALEPVGDTESLVEWLTTAGVPHGIPSAFPPNGPAFFINTTITRLSSGATRVFVCDYRDRQRIHAGQAAWAAELAERNGGPLGILGVLELRLEATDVEGTRTAWSGLMATTEQNGDEVLVRFQAGPAIRIIRGPADRLAGVALSVRSLAAATTFLDAAGLSERSATGELRIARDAVGGLELSLVEP